MFNVYAYYVTDNVPSWTSSTARASSLPGSMAQIDLSCVAKHQINQSINQTDLRLEYFQRQNVSDSERMLRTHQMSWQLCSSV